MKLIETPAGELLEKFGAGMHKPGSGSASALQGLLSIQMLRTVIDLTTDPKRRLVYSKSISTLDNIKQKIEQHIQIDLELLFQQDSEEFDKVITLRTKRDNEKDRDKKTKLVLEIEAALLTSTNTPLRIAELCLELVEFAVYVFDNGFRTARGDSAVALNAALSVIMSCLSIVELNLISLPPCKEVEEILIKKQTIKEAYDRLYPNAERCRQTLELEANEKRGFYEDIKAFKDGKVLTSVTSERDIEGIVTHLQNTAWKHRDLLLKKGEVYSPIDILQADLILKKVLDYNFTSVESLETFEHNGELFEIAGLIDKNLKSVKISKSFSPEIQNFTAAHELGHAILHKQVTLHRDRPKDGSKGSKRNNVEIEADKFATYFLMPTKLVEKAFFEYFKTRIFKLNSDTVFGLTGQSTAVSRLKNQCANRRGLARFLASVESYQGRNFNSLAKLFKVSIETMAIRLEELELLDF